MENTDILFFPEILTLHTFSPYMTNPFFPNPVDVRIFSEFFRKTEKKFNDIMTTKKYYIFFEAILDLILYI